MSACGDTNGDFACELPRGHDGMHEAAMGFGWLTWRPAASPGEES